MTDQPLNAAHKPLSRRTMLKTAAWSAPVIAVAIAAPAAAASGESGTIPESKLTVSNYGIGPGSASPLAWYGGQIQYQGNWQDPSTGTVDYSVVLTGPAGLSTTIHSGTAAIGLYGSFPWPQYDFGTAPMPSGTYAVTVTVWASDATIVNAKSYVV